MRTLIVPGLKFKKRNHCKSSKAEELIHNIHSATCWLFSSKQQQALFGDLTRCVGSSSSLMAQKKTQLPIIQLSFQLSYFNCPLEQNRSKSLLQIHLPFHWLTWQKKNVSAVCVCVCVCQALFQRAKQGAGVCLRCLQPTKTHLLHSDMTKGRLCHVPAMC